MSSCARVLLASSSMARFRITSIRPLNGPQPSSRPMKRFAAASRFGISARSWKTVSMPSERATVGEEIATCLPSRGSLRSARTRGICS